MEPRDQDLQHSTLRDVVQEALQPEVNREDVHTEELGEQRAGTEEPVYTGKLGRHGEITYQADYSITITWYFNTSQLNGISGYHVTM